MSVPAVRRIVVGVDGSAESTAAVRWACREAGLRGAEVHAVHVREAPHTASYAMPSQAGSPEDADSDVLWKTVMPDRAPDDPDVPVRTEVASGLAARVLLQRCDGADMLVLGTSSDQRGTPRPAGPVIRACLRRSPCPVVVISEEQDPLRGSGPSRGASGRQAAPAGGNSGARSSRALGILPMPTVAPA
ncbi:MAG: universal stress protein [Streptosporangiales bacterium]|nr:universal stress protein [Streptosporangiales bacterium]